VYIVSCNFIEKFTQGIRSSAEPQSVCTAAQLSGTW